MRGMFSGMFSKKPQPVFNKAEIAAILGNLKSGVFTADDIQAFADLFRQIKERDKITAIISDEAGGRLVALVLHRLVNLERRKKNLEPIPIYFVVGGNALSASEKRTQAVREFVGEHAVEFGNVLLCTEYILAGGNTNNLIRNLQTGGVRELSIAALHANDSSALESRLKVNLYIGSRIRDHFDFPEKFSGVSARRSPETSPHPVRHPEARSEDIEAVRRDVDTIVQAIAEKLL